MKNEKMHKIDLILIIGFICIGMIGSLMDVLGNINFPVYSIKSLYASYIWWIVLLIYSSIKYKDETKKPKYVKWYWFFILPYIHIIGVLIGFIIFNNIINIFNL